jgi:hypothetical protein
LSHFGSDQLPRDPLTEYSDSLENYYASNRSPCIISHKENNKSTVQDQEIGRVFAEYNDNLIIVAGENKKEHDT